MSDGLKQPMNEIGYRDRCKKALDFLDRAKALRSRLLKSISLTEDETKAKTITRKEKLDQQICEMFAKAHFETFDHVLADRRLDIANLYVELFSMIDQIQIDEE